MSLHTARACLSRLRRLAYRPKLLERYLIRELLRVFALLFPVLTALIVFGGAFREATERGLSAGQALRIIPYVIPMTMPYTVPVSLLLSICIVYGRMSADQELIGVKAGGISLLAMIWPGWILAALLSAGVLFASDQAVPWASRQILRIVTSETREMFFDVLRSRHVLVEPRMGFTIHVQGVEGDRLLMPTIVYLPKNGNESTITAREANVDFDLARRVVITRLIDGKVDMPGRQRATFQQERIELPLPQELATIKERNLSFRELRKERQERLRYRDSIQAQRDLELALIFGRGDFARLTGPEFAYYDLSLKFTDDNMVLIPIAASFRMAVASGPLCFALLGVPFSIYQGRRQILSIFFLCFLPILVVYYPTLILALNLCKSHTVGPSWALWMPNAMLCLAALPVLRNVLKH